MDVTTWKQPLVFVLIPSWNWSTEAFYSTPLSSKICLFIYIFFTSVQCEKTAWNPPLKLPRGVRTFYRHCVCLCECTVNKKKKWGGCQAACMLCCRDFPTLRCRAKCVYVYLCLWCEILMCIVLLKQKVRCIERIWMKSKISFKVRKRMW